MIMLIVAAVAFLAIHLLVSGTRLRDAITSATGERPYLGLFSLASLGILVWLIKAYFVAQASGDNRVIYDLGHVRDLGIPVVALAFVLGLQGLFMRNPTAVLQEGAIGNEGAVHGVVRITRHPFLWGVVLWSGFHLLANGDLASVIFFGTFFVTALLGTFSIDAKRARKLGPAWDAFAAKTSNVPFAAVFAGRNTLNVGESLGWRFWLALLIFVALLFAHPHLFGASPFPGGARPF
jgi:uncharacterized membrane protein